MSCGDSGYKNQYLSTYRMQRWGSKKAVAGPMRWKTNFMEWGKTMEGVAEQEKGVTDEERGRGEGKESDRRSENG
jgi:hypothetical protein